MSNYRLYPIEQFGITLRETEILLTQTNGIMPCLEAPLPAGYLGDTIRAAAHSSAEDHQRFGRDLSYPKDDSPQMPAILWSLAEKLSRLDQWQQDAITYYAMGFWAGIGIAHIQYEEAAAQKMASGRKN